MPTDFNITTPALLFPAISLLFLGYTTRFMGLAGLIRSLHDRYRTESSRNATYRAQRENLSARLVLTRRMQALGALAFFLCAAAMFALLIGGEWGRRVAKASFGVSLLALMLSLVFALAEIGISLKALEIELGAEPLPPPSPLAPLGVPEDVVVSEAHPAIDAPAPLTGVSLTEAPPPPAPPLSPERPTPPPAPTAAR